MAELRAKARDCLQMGVEHVWSVDPLSRESYEHFQHGMESVKHGILHVTGTLIEIPVTEILGTL
jgi:hypothetical protein